MVGLLVVLAGAGCHRKRKPRILPVSKTPVGAKFEDPGKTFAVAIPQGWVQQDAQGLGGIVLLLQPQGDTSGTSLNIQAEYCGEDTMLEEYCRLSDENSARMVEGFRPLKKRELGNLGGAPAAILRFAFTRNGKSYEVLQYTAINPPEVYQVVLTAPRGSLKQHEDAYYALLNSWKFTRAWNVQAKPRSLTGGKPAAQPSSPSHKAPQPKVHKGGGGQ